MADATAAIEGVDDAFPLNPAQLGMLYHSLAEPGTGVYVGTLDATLPDDLDEKAFRQAWEIIVARHDALRSVVVWEGVDEPLQVVRSAGHLEWEEHPDPLPEENGHLPRDFVETFRSEGVDLAGASAMRFAMGRLSSGARWFLWACHHALVDDWSQALALGEVQQVYRTLIRGGLPDDAPGPEIGGFADWLASRDSKADETFWRETFAGFAEPARLPNFGPPVTPDETRLHAKSDITLDRETSERLRQAANRSRVTLAAMVGGVWSVVLHRLTGSEDIAFGLAATLRPAEVDGMDRAIGNFVATLPARSRILEHRTLADLIRHHQSFVREAQPRTGMALSRVQEFARLPKDQTLIDTILSVNQDALGALESAEAPLFQTPLTAFKSSFPFAVVVMPGDEIGLRVIFDPKRYSDETAGLVLQCFAAALEATPEAMDEAPGSLSLIGRKQRTHAKTGLAGAELPDIPGLIEQIRAAAARTPERPALRSTGRTLTYAELVVAIDTIAARLGEAGLGRGDRVGLYLDRSVDVPIGMLGCLAAGVAYVPFDAAFPDTRLDRMIAAARLSAIITTEAHHVRLSGQTRNLLSFEDLIRPHPGSAAPVECRSDDIAYMMFTSGSTGEPKAVLVTHGNLVASTAARTKWYDAQPTAYLLLSSHSFDSSVAGIYWTLTAGGTLCIPDAEEARTIASIADMLRSWSITHTLCLPSLYRVLLDTAADTLTDLQTVIVAGEATTRELIAEHRASGIEARLVNEYGPTEATVWCAAADLTDTPADAEVAIGGPIPGCILRVRDAQGAPVPPGLPGELLVGGPGVAAGYFDLETETRARFVTEPDGMRLYRTGDIVREAADGALIYIGRSDGQVKIRGYRVELSEIEKVLAARPDVREAAVAVFGSGPDARLVGFVQGKGGTAIQPEDLSGTCREALPAYMIPSRFVLLDQMPRTPNGKIDRNALPEPAFAPPAATSVLPSTMTESVLAEIWRTTLWLDREIGITEDFHDLGGHSLIAIRLLNEIQETFDIRLPASSLGRITTVEEQAKLIETARREGGLIVRDTPAARTSEVLSGLSDDDEAKLVAMVSNWRAPAARDGFKIRAANEGGSLSPLFFCFLDEYSFNQLADALGPDQPIYCIRGSNGVVPMSGEEAFQDNMRRTALSYLPEVLELAGDRPILLGGYCQGALVALNIAAFLTALQRDVATVIAIEHVPTIRFPGHVDILCGDQSFLNPYRQFAAPERAWERRYGSYTFELIPGEYQKAFHPQYIVEFAASIRKRMAEARTRAMPALARAARSVTWGDPPDIGAIHPGDMRTIEIRLRNTGTMPWPASQESGLRLRARWSAEAGADVPGEDSHAGFARPVAPGAWTSIPIEIRAPVTLGFHRLEIDMIEEGIAAFSKMGNDILKLPVSVDPSAPRTAAPATPQEASALDPLHDLVAAFSQATEEAAARGTRWAKPDAALTRDLVASLRNLGVFHLRGNRLGEAQRALASALEIDPADGRSLVALARVRLAQRRFLSAQAMIWRARKTDPDSAMEAAALQALRLSPRSFARFVRDWLRAASAGAQSKSDR